MILKKGNTSKEALRRNWDERWMEVEVEVEAEEGKEESEEGRGVLHQGSSAQRGN